MSAETQSERLFQEFCRLYGISCERLTPTGCRTPDFVVDFGGTRVICEVKQIDPNKADESDLAEPPHGADAGRLVPNRLRAKLKKVSAQLKSASQSGRPTLLVMYDHTPFKGYTLHTDAVEAMFGRNSVRVRVPMDPSLPPQISSPFFGGDRGMGPGRNTAVSAIAILDVGPHPSLTLRVYHNPYAAVRLDPRAFASLPVTQPVLPDAPVVSL
jgi:hypothetical protein